MENKSEKDDSCVSGREKGQADVSYERNEGSQGERPGEPGRRGLDNQTPTAFKAAAAAAAAATSDSRSGTASVSTAIAAAVATATAAPTALSASAAAAAYRPRVPHGGHNPRTGRHRRCRQDVPEACRH